MTKTPNLIQAFFQEPQSYFIRLLMLAFLAITFSERVAIIYGLLVAASFVVWVTMKPKIRFSSVSGNTPQAITTAAVTYAAFIIISFLTISFLQGIVDLQPGFTSIISRIGSATFGGQAPATPILESNFIVIFIVGAIIIAPIETRALIADAMTVFGKVTNTNPFNLHSLRTWALFAFIATIGVFFHIQAKGVTDNAALILVFIFWMVSAWLIAKTREAEAAVYVHVINNAVALLVAFSIIALG